MDYFNKFCSGRINRVNHHSNGVIYSTVHDGKIITKLDDKAKTLAEISDKDKV